MATRRGTSNTNARGSAEARRRRKAYLLEVYRADVDVLTMEEISELDDVITAEVGILGAYFHAMMDPLGGFWLVPQGLGRPAVRCYRCGDLLDYETMEVDRIKAGCNGGTYARGNIRPACSPCNIKTGNEARDKRRQK